MQTTVQRVILKNYSNVDLIKYCNSDGELPVIKPNIIGEVAYAHDGSALAGTRISMPEDVQYNLFIHRIKSDNPSLFNALMIQNGKNVNLGAASVESTDPTTGTTVSRNFSSVVLTSPAGIPGNIDKPVTVTVKFGI